MAGVGKVIFALLVGFMLGAAATVYLLKSGAADVFIRKTEVVEDLQRRLRDVEQQRDQLGRQLADVVERAGRMETAFGEMERRFRTLQDEVGRGARPAEPAPGATP